MIRPLMFAAFASATLALAPSVQATLLANGTSFNGVSINGISFNGVNLNGVQFNGMALNGMQLNGAKFNGVAQNGSRSDSLATQADVSALAARYVILPDGTTLPVTAP